MLSILKKDIPNNPWDKPKAKDSNPWGDNKGSNRGPSGSSGGSGGPGNNGPDLSDWFGGFKQQLPKKGDSFSGGPNIFLIILVIIGAWLLSGVYRVLPEEHGVVQRFGAYQKTVTEQGLHYHLPAPIETVKKPNVTFERRIEIGYRDPTAGRGGASNIIDRPDESLMLTGDANIVDIDFVVQWKVGSAKDFLFNIRDPEGTIKKVAESAMREVIGQNRLQEIITERRADVASRVRSIMQDILNEYGAGVSITQVLIQDASVPQPVMGAFEDVIRADQDAETMKNQALQYRNDIVPRARGEAIKMIKDSEAYRERVVNEAEGGAARFTKVYESYKEAKDVTRKRLYLETLEEIFETSNKVVLDPGASGQNVLPYLPLDSLKKR